MKLVIANWKMNPVSLKEAKALFLKSAGFARRAKNIHLVICPSFIWLSELSKLLRKPVELGAQNVSWSDKGALTGEISPPMLKEFKCSWVIVGHSERRENLSENDAMVNKKVLKALSSGLKVVLAVGERKRTAARAVVDVILEHQLKAALKNLPSERLVRLTVAYEPVWAIGTGLHASADDALQAALLVRQVVARQFGRSVANKLKVLYGGSVDKSNIAAFVNQRGIDGVLVGGASLDVKGFGELLKKIR